MITVKMPMHDTAQRVIEFNVETAFMKENIVGCDLIEFNIVGEHDGLLEDEIEFANTWLFKITSKKAIVRIGRNTNGLDLEITVSSVRRKVAVKGERYYSPNFQFEN
jgi:hypothetical protein